MDTVLLVHFLNLIDILSILPDIEVCFIVSGESCQLGPWEFGKWLKV